MYAGLFGKASANLHQLFLVAVLGITDGIARPIINAVGVYFFLSDRFRADSQLHVWSWRLGLPLAGSFVEDAGYLWLFVATSDILNNWQFLRTSLWISRFIFGQEVLLTWECISQTCN